MIKRCDRDNRFILAFVLFEKAADHTLYHDQALTKKVTSAELESDFLSGKLSIATVADSKITGYKQPVFFTAPTFSGTTQTAAAKVTVMTTSGTSTITVGVQELKAQDS